jgi:serine O-acetyltransferase
MSVCDTRDSSLSSLKPRSSFLTMIRADLARFQEDNGGLRNLIRGLASQGFLAILVYRFFRWFHERGIPTQPFRFLAERLVEMTTGISIPVEAQIGKGLRIHHFGGVILHPEVVIGEHCTLYHDVTLGDRGGWGGAPRVGNNVLIGAGAKVLGRIDVGDRSVIGANAVVLSSVPPDSLAVGVPAICKPGRSSPPPGRA